MLARLYDALHDPALQPVLTCPTDTGSGGYTHRYFRAPASAEDLVAARDAIAAWARLTYGWMGRSPDYKAAFLATLGANAEFYAPYQDNARRWYRAAQERVLFLNHALVQPPGDRPRPGAVGGRARLRGRGQVEHVLPALGILPARHAARLHAPGREAGLRRRPAAQGRGGRRLRPDTPRPGVDRRGDRLAQSLLGPHRRDGARARAVGGRHRAAEPGLRAGLPAVRDHRLAAREGDHREHPRQRPDLSH